jgi:hypothetical protein
MPVLGCYAIGKKLQELSFGFLKSLGRMPIACSDMLLGILFNRALAVCLEFVFRHWY